MTEFYIVRQGHVFDGRSTRDTPYQIRESGQGVIGSYSTEQEAVAELCAIYARSAVVRG